jgi:hypothetical protein
VHLRLVPFVLILGVLGVLLPGAPAGAQVAALPASGFRVTPDRTVDTCNHGRGSQLSIHALSEPFSATGQLTDGTTLTAFSQIFPDKDETVLVSATARCTPNAGFGVDGTKILRVPPTLAPHGSGNALWVNTVAPRPGGGALLGGTYRNRWVVAALHRNGSLDTSFGHGGWVVLPWAGEVTAALQLPSGRVVVGGDNGGAGCCSLNHAAELLADGRLNYGFGKAGRVSLPNGEDSGVDSLAREPDGDILAVTGGGNMGCWSVRLAMFTPYGRAVAGFKQRLDRFWSKQKFGTFVGDVYVDGDGFTVVGTGQTDCYAFPNSNSSSKGQVGVRAHFRTNGTLPKAPVRFASKMYGSVDAFRYGRDTLLVEETYADETKLWVRLLRPDGTFDHSFGRHGQIVVLTPWRGADSIEVEVTDATAGTHTLVLTASRGERTVALTRVRV